MLILLPFEKNPSYSPLILSLLIPLLLSGCGFFRSSADHTVGVSQPLSIVLPANFSTGYRWVLDPPLQTAHLLDESYSSPSLPGAPGKQTLRVVFPREGRFNLKFAYRRLWEPATIPAAQTTNFVVQVSPSDKNSNIIQQLFPEKNLPSTVPLPEEDQPKPAPGKLQIRKA
jgi:predicted secreted protein